LGRTWVMRARPILSIIAVALTALAVSGLAEAQPVAREYRVGVLLAAPPTAAVPYVEALRERLRELGYLEKKNLSLELRWVTPAEGFGGLDRLAADLVRSKVDVLVAWTTPAAVAIKRATHTIPIVVVSIGDPVGSGLVASLSRPGGNVTGVSNVSKDLSGKLLQLLREVRPDATRIAVLRNPTNPGAASTWAEAQAAGASLGLQIQDVGVRESRELESAFAAMKRDRAAGVVIIPDPLFLDERRRLAELAQQARLVTVFQRSENVKAGGLMAYGPKLTEQFRQAAGYVDRILKGAKPADLPVEQPIYFELVINLKTAKVLGLAIPPSMLARADHLIE
jgi:putative tryptophan/tyrosine transport system substrate-binding protein